MTIVEEPEAVDISSGHRGTTMNSYTQFLIVDGQNTHNPKPDKLQYGDGNWVYNPYDYKRWYLHHASVEGHIYENTWT